MAQSLLVGLVERATEPAALVGGDKPGSGPLSSLAARQPSPGHPQARRVFRRVRAFPVLSPNLEL